MEALQKKYLIKIPKEISVIYAKRKRILFFKGPLGQKILKLKLKVYLNKSANFLQVGGSSFLKTSTNQKKGSKAIQGTTTSLIKQILLEVSSVLHKKMKLIGVGFKVFPVKVFKQYVLQFKLGYSHEIYFKVPNNFKVTCDKTVNVFVFGDSYQTLNQITATIRSYKKPDPYKGKGILYENEKIELKEGKKV